MSAACSAFTYAVTTASQLVATGAHDHALVVGADVMSSIIDYKDRSTCVLFGDASGAMVLGPSEDPERGILGTYLHSDGDAAGILTIQGGGSLHPPSAEMLENLTLYMNKVRQAAITREIIEVVSGAAAT